MPGITLQAVVEQYAQAHSTSSATQQQRTQAQRAVDSYTQQQLAGLAKACAATRAAGYAPVAPAKCTLANAPANVHQLALAVLANVPLTAQYATGAALVRAAAPVHAKAVATAARHCYRLTGLRVGKGNRHGVHANTAQAWLAAYVLAQHVQPGVARVLAGQGSKAQA